MSALKLLTRESSASLEVREASLRPASFNAAARTVEMVVATSTPVRRRDERGEFDEILDIAGADLSAFVGAPIVNGHRTDGGVDQVIGTVISARKEGDQLIAVGQLTDRPEVAGIVRDIETGIHNQVSAGYVVTTYADGTANGRRTRTATKWAPREVSFVAVGADPNARTRSAEPTPNRARLIRNLIGNRAPITLADDLIDRNATLDQARAALFDHMLTRGDMHFRASVGNDYTDPSLQNRAIGDALYAKMTGTAASGPARELVHRSAIDLMTHFARVNGITLRSESPDTVYQAVMTTRAAGLHSTSDFPILMQDTMNRRLGELTRAAKSGAAAIVTTGTARDFRPMTEARLSSFPSLEPVDPDGGEIKWGTMDEEGETLAIASFARAIGVSFKVMVNDDLNAIDRSVRDIAFATEKLRAKLIVAALSAKMADGKTLFHADHNNLAASGAAPDETTLSAGRVAMMKQTPVGSDEPLGLSPAILLVAAELQTSAEKLVAAINPASSADVNVFSGKLQVAVEPRLLTETEWYLFASPGTYPVIRFLTLAGFEGPRFETSQEFTRLGSSYRVHWHCGAGPIDHRGAWKNPGQ